MNKILVLFAALSFLIFTGACFTPALHSGKPTKSYQEKVETFLMSEDKEQLIVIGEKYHYIFPTNDVLKFITQWPDKKQQVKASFSTFRVQLDQSLAGSYTLFIRDSRKLSPEAKQLLISKGFFDNKSSNTLRYHGGLAGKRYLANEVRVPETLKLNKQYTIQIIENDTVSAGEVAKRIALTPLAVAADGLLILGGAPLLLFVLIFD